MKNLLFKIYLFLALIAAIAIQIHVVVAASKRHDKVALPKNMVEAIRIDNENFGIIVDNALFLVQQIEHNKHDETERKKALKNIDIALKKLSSDIQTAIEPCINTIKEESHKFSFHRKPLEKYNSTAIENALLDLTMQIKQLAENKAESVVLQAQQKLMSAIDKTETIKKEANIAINKVREQLAQQAITSIDAAKRIGEQNYRISAAERALRAEIQQAQDSVTQTDLQTGYLNQFAADVYNMGMHALAPFKAGYGYTDEEKEIAHAIIVQLEQQLEEETQRQNMELNKPDYAKNPKKLAAVKQQFERTIQAIYNEIYQQKLITGEVMSTKRKLFWGALAAAGASLAVGLTYNYFMLPTEVVSPVVPAVPPKSEPVVEGVANQPQVTSEQSEISAEAEVQQTAEEQNVSTTTDTSLTEENKESSESEAGSQGEDHENLKSDEEDPGSASGAPSAANALSANAELEEKLVAAVEEEQEGHEAEKRRIEEELRNETLREEQEREQEAAEAQRQAELAILQEKEQLAVIEAERIAREAVELKLQQERLAAEVQRQVEEERRAEELRLQQEEEKFAAIEAAHKAELERQAEELRLQREEESFAAIEAAHKAELERKAEELRVQQKEEKFAAIEAAHKAELERQAEELKQQEEQDAGTETQKEEKRPWYGRTKWEDEQREKRLKRWQEELERQKESNPSWPIEIDISSLEIKEAGSTNVEPGELPSEETGS